MSEPKDQAPKPAAVKHFANIEEAQAAMKADQEERRKARNKRQARHEAAHIIVGDAIQEKMEWVNVEGMPGVKYAMVHFLYSPEALHILTQQWDGTDNDPVMKAKAWDLATCFAAGHRIENEKHPEIETISQRLADKPQLFVPFKFGGADRDMVAWLLTLIGRGNIDGVIEAEARVLELVNPYREKLERISDHLAEKGYIMGQDFIDIRKDPA